jgi:hypothetical protein
MLIIEEFCRTRLYVWIAPDLSAVSRDASISKANGTISENRPANETASESVNRAHNAIIACRTDQRRIRQNACIAILPRQRHVSPNVVSKRCVKHPGIIKSGTAGIFDLTV